MLFEPYSLTTFIFGDLWTSNVMMFRGPRFYLRHPENLSGIFVGAGIGSGWKSIQVDYELWGYKIRSLPSEKECQNSFGYWLSCTNLAWKLSNYQFDNRNQT